MQGLFRDSADQVLSERFRESLAAIARMRHPDQVKVRVRIRVRVSANPNPNPNPNPKPNPDQSRPDRRFLPELHGNKVRVRVLGLGLGFG